MAFVISTFEVEDYGKWRAVFDSLEEQRKEFGIRNIRVFQDSGNPNRVGVVTDGDKAVLEAYYGSQILKDAMAEAGVLERPDFTFFNEVT